MGYIHRESVEDLLGLSVSEPRDIEGLGHFIPNQLYLMNTSCPDHFPVKNGDVFPATVHLDFDLEREMAQRKKDVSGPKMFASDLGERMGRFHKAI